MQDSTATTLDRFRRARGKAWSGFRPGTYFTTTSNVAPAAADRRPGRRGDLQYTALWRTAQRLTAKPVKFGTVTAEIIGLLCSDHHYKDVRARIMAISDALREELHELADAGCPVIQIEEPQIHLLAARGFVSERSIHLHGRGLQQHGQRLATRPSWPQLLGQPFAAAHVRRGAELQAGDRVFNRATPT